MSLITPTTAEINANIIAQLEASLNQTIPLLPKSFLRVLAKALAAVFILLYKYAGSIFLNIFVQTASDQDTIVNGETINPLKFWGRLIGVGDPTAATNAELLIDITVTNQTGSLPSGTQLVNANNGVTYITIGSILLDAPTKQAIIRAVSDQAGGGGAGVIGNLDPGDIVTFANPLANVDRSASVDSQTVTGANGESTEAYRQRIIDRFQKRPQGGAYADYEQWSEEVEGIINAYPYTSDCPGQVDVFIEATVASSGSPDGIPTAAQLQAVLDSIELDENGIPTRRPANALANTFPITRVPFDVSVNGLIVDNLAQVQADITTGVEEYFLDREPFIVGLSVAPRTDRITSSAVGGVVDDIVSAAGGIFAGVIVTQSAVVINIFALGIGEKAKADSVTFV
jgi:uncharacterized phage protein gp47/JayE